MVGFTPIFTGGGGGGTVDAAARASAAKALKGANYGTRAQALAELPTSGIPAGTPIHILRDETMPGHARPTTATWTGGDLADTIDITRAIPRSLGGYYGAPQYDSVTAPNRQLSDAAMNDALDDMAERGGALSIEGVHFFAENHGARYEGSGNDAKTKHFRIVGQGVNADTGGDHRALSHSTLCWVGGGKARPQRFMFTGRGTVSLSDLNYCSVDEPVADNRDFIGHTMCQLRVSNLAFFSDKSGQISDRLLDSHYGQIDPAKDPTGNNAFRHGGQIGDQLIGLDPSGTKSQIILTDADLSAFQAYCSEFRGIYINGLDRVATVGMYGNGIFYDGVWEWLDNGTNLPGDLSTYFYISGGVLPDAPGVPGSGGAISRATNVVLARIGSEIKVRRRSIVRLQYTGKFVYIAGLGAYDANSRVGSSPPNFAGAIEFIGDPATSNTGATIFAQTNDGRPMLIGNIPNDINFYSGDSGEPSRMPRVEIGGTESAPSLHSHARFRGASGGSGLRNAIRLSLRSDATMTNGVNTLVIEDAAGAVQTGITWGSALILNGASQGDILTGLANNANFTNGLKSWGVKRDPLAAPNPNTSPSVDMLIDSGGVGNLFIIANAMGIYRKVHNNSVRPIVQFSDAAGGAAQQPGVVWGGDVGSGAHPTFANGITLAKIASNVLRLAGAQLAFAPFTVATAPTPTANNLYALGACSDHRHADGTIGALVQQIGGGWKAIPLGPALTTT